MFGDGLVSFWIVFFDGRSESMVLQLVDFVFDDVEICISQKIELTDMIKMINMYVVSQ